MYRVIEVAKMLGVSKVTVYKKINKNKKLLKGHVHTRSNITYIDDEGVAMIKTTLEELIFQDPLDTEDSKKALVEELDRTVKILMSQVAQKKAQLENKDIIIESYKTLIKSIKGKAQYLESKLNETK